MQDFRYYWTSIPYQATARLLSYRANVMTTPFIRTIRNALRRADEMVHDPAAISHRCGVHEELQMFTKKCNVPATGQRRAANPIWTHPTAVWNQCQVARCLTDNWGPRFHGICATQKPYHLPKHLAHWLIRPCHVLQSSITVFPSLSEMGVNRSSWWSSAPVWILFVVFGI